MSPLCRSVRSNFEREEKILTTMSMSKLKNVFFRFEFVCVSTLLKADRGKLLFLVLEQLTRSKIKTSHFERLMNNWKTSTRRIFVLTSKNYFSTCSFDFSFFWRWVSLCLLRSCFVYYKEYCFLICFMSYQRIGSNCCPFFKRIWTKVTNHLK